MRHGLQKVTVRQHHSRCSKQCSLNIRKIGAHKIVSLLQRPPEELRIEQNVECNPNSQPTSFNETIYSFPTLDQLPWSLVRRQPIPQDCCRRRQLIHLRLLWVGERTLGSVLTVIDRDWMTYLKTGASIHIRGEVQCANQCSNRTKNVGCLLGRYK